MLAPANLLGSYHDARSHPDRWRRAFSAGAVALLHTLSVRFFEHLARIRPQNASFFHLLGEVKVVFGFWAMVLVGTLSPTLVAAAAFLLL